MEPEKQDGPAWQDGETGWENAPAYGAARLTWWRWVACAALLALQLVGCAYVLS